MAILKVPRCTTAQRLGLVPAQGEVIFDTDLNSYWGGNGVATGGVPIFEETTKEVKFSVTGVLTVQAGIARWYPDRDITLMGCYFGLGTSSTAGAVAIDCKKNGVSIFSGNAPSAAINTYKSGVTALAIALTPADYLTFDVVAAGVGASYLTAVLTYR